MKIQKINSTIFNIMLFMGAFSILSIISCSQKNEKDYILECAIEVSKKIESTSLKGSTLGLVAQSYAESGQYDKALEIAEEIDDSFMRSFAFSWVSNAMEKDEKLYDA